MYRFGLLIFGLLISGCSTKMINIKKENEIIHKFYIPVKIKLKERQIEWYKKEGTNFIGIIDSNSSVGGEFYKENKNITGEVLFVLNNDKYSIIRSPIFNCDNNSTNLEFGEFGNKINTVFILKKQTFCFKEKGH